MSGCFKVLTSLNEGQFPANDFELVVKCSKDVEYILESEFNATGSGLSEKLKSVDKDLPDYVKFKLHYIERMRDNLIHKQNYDKIPNRSDYIKTYNEVKVEMSDILKKDLGQKKLEASSGQNKDECIIS
mmetsp:Transcript_90/g.98  ORF Transcript_90/g.98 Transcript_90/m.98 type:complete len:129 (+) Transcript_90:88-474(+)